MLIISRTFFQFKTHHVLHQVNAIHISLSLTEQYLQTLKTNTPIEMISDATIIPLDIVTKPFFSCDKIFFNKNILSTARKESLGKKKILGQEKNFFVTSSRGIFLASKKN